MNMNLLSLLKTFGFFKLLVIAAASWSLSYGSELDHADAAGQYAYDDYNYHDSHGHRGRVSPTPDGFDKYLVFMAAGVVPKSPDLSGFVGGVEGGDGLFFQREIMNRSEEEIEQRRTKATDFFRQRFGIEVDDPRVTFSGFELDLQAQYRAHTISGEAVSAPGWRVHDGGWIVVVSGPEGIVLGGEFEGVHVPQLTVMSFGEYYIERTRRKRQHQSHNQVKPIIIEYRSSAPIIIDRETGQFSFRCELFSEEYGEGLATGTSHQFPLAVDEMGLIDLKLNTRNVLTFPPLGDHTKIGNNEGDDEWPHHRRELYGL